MLRQISWATFLLFLSLLIAAYYLVIGVRFLLPAWLEGRRGKGEGSGAPASVPGGSMKDGAKGVDAFKLLDVAIGRVKGIIHKVVKDGVAREDLIGAIREGLAETKQFRGTGSGTAIINAINREMRSLGVEVLTEKEAGSIWK